VILSSGRIKMLVAPEVSNLTNTGAITLNNITVPALQTRRAETMVEVGSGQSIVIGGLLQNNVTKEIKKVPWLGDIPVLGKLFTSQEFQRNETELVIIATPYLVKPYDAKKYASAPPPSQATRVVRGHATPKAAPRPASAPRRLNGPTGFVLE
ncbi:MAG: type II and III secretion system protein family protein, partial [Bauldia litoralis]